MAVAWGATLQLVGQTAELGTFRRDLGCTNDRKSKSRCAKQFPSVCQDAVKDTKVARYMLKTLKI